MILSDEEIREAHAPYPVFRDSHLEANARIRELETRLRDCQTDAQGWHERYVICCEDSKLDIEALREQIEVADAELRELAEAAEWRDECQEMARCENPFFVFKTSCPTLEDWNRAENADKSFFSIKEAAEAAYQDALKAAEAPCSTTASSSPGC